MAARRDAQPIRADRAVESDVPAHLRATRRPRPRRCAPEPLPARQHRSRTNRPSTGSAWSPSERSCSSTVTSRGLAPGSSGWTSSSSSPGSSSPISCSRRSPRPAASRSRRSGCGGPGGSCPRSYSCSSWSRRVRRFRGDRAGGARVARRSPRLAVLRTELASGALGQSVLRPVRLTVAAAAHVVTRDRGAVVSDLAVDVPRDHPPRPETHPGDHGHRARPRRGFCDLDGRARRKRRLACVLRHRHACPGAAHRRGARGGLLGPARHQEPERAQQSSS